MAIAVVGTGAYGQGVFNFSNFSGPVDAPVKDHTGQNVSSGAFMAGVAWGVGAISDPAQLSLFPSANTPFLGAAFPGYYFGPGITLGAAVNGTVTLQALYWNSAGPGGSSFATAKATQGGEWGASSLFQVQIPSSALAPAVDLVGLTSTTMTINTIIPEPSTLAFLGLGTGALLLFRRRK